MGKNLSNIAKKYGIEIEEAPSTVVEKSLSVSKLLMTKKLLECVPSELEVARDAIDSITSSIESALTDLTDTHKNSENNESLELLNKMLDECRVISTKIHQIDKCLSSK